MEEKYNLSQSLKYTVYSADIMKQDAACKEIMKDRHFLACILKAVVPEYEDVTEEDIALKCIEPGSIQDDVPVSRNLTNIVGSTQEDTTVNEGVVKYDIIFEARAEIPNSKQKYKSRSEAETIIVNLKIDLESQRRHDPGYAITKRAAYYCARACLKIAFCKLCVTLCGRFGPDEGGVVGYVN